ncbi:MAG TPA: ABC transporter permease, partial [Blastocatellia bacterium]|nr:ABC transporter permease [Blastocatellia bacterium]
SVVNAVLLEPLPYKDADNIVLVWENNRRRSPDQRNVVNPANFMDWQEQNTVFSEMAAFIDVSAILTNDGEPEELPAQLASPNLFTLLGVEAIRGRAFNSDDGKPDAPRVAVISYGLWQRRFGGDPNIIGRKLILNRNESTVIGVMPVGFQWHIRQNSLSGRVADVWMPYVITSEMRQRRGRFLSTVARLKPGVTIAQAQAEMTGLGARLEQQYSDFNTNWGVNVVPLRTQLVGEIRLALWILLGAVAFVLLIACANVANLLLARATARQKEIAVRAALGATRGTVIRQLLTESVMLSVLGGSAGLVLAWWGTEALIRLSPPELADLQAVQISLPVLLFTFVIALLTGIIFGLVPAVEAARVDLNETLKEGGKNPGSTSRSHRLRNVFVVAEVALALVLLICAGLLIRSFAHLQAVDPGFNASNLLTMRVSLPGRKYDNDQKRLTFFRQAIERMQTLPGVEAAGAISFLPFAGPGAGTSVAIEGRPPLPAGQQLTTGVLVSDWNYFRTMQIPLKRGRLFTEQEATEMRHVVVINEAFAQKYFPNEEPLGKRIIISMKDENVPTEIIGIVADSKFTTLDSTVEPMSYWPHPELVYPSMTLVLRTKGEATSLAAAARDVIRALDSEQPVSDVRTMESVLAKSVSRARFNTLLLAVFALVALLLAAVGIYGVMAYSVSQRSHEIGIRMALGARQNDVLQLVLRQGMKLALLGVAIGLGAAFGLTRLLTTLLFGVKATDPFTFAGIALLLAGIALLACYIPARRATKVDPMIALRYE